MFFLCGDGSNEKESCCFFVFFSVLFIYFLRRMGWRRVRENDVKKTA